MAKRIAELDRLFRAHVLTSGTGAGALYAPDGTVAFSTGRRSIGTRPQGSPLLTQISTRLTRVAGTRTFDVIVPVGFGRGAPAGAVVLSQRYSAITGAAARTYIPVAIALELLLAGLFLALLPIVRRAIRQTHGERHAIQLLMD